MFYENYYGMKIYGPGYVLNKRDFWNRLTNNATFCVFQTTLPFYTTQIIKPFLKFKDLTHPRLRVGILANRDNFIPLNVQSPFNKQ